MLGVDDAALAMLASGIIASAGQLYANRQNISAQKHWNDVNYAIAEANNATQINLANTAHQREVADLRRAGLNPILSAGGHGAAVPSLTSPRGEAPSIENPAQGLATSAGQLARYISDEYRTGLQQAKADVKSTNVQNQILQTQAKEARLRKDALDELTTETSLEFDKSLGRYKTVYHLNSPNSPYFKAIKEGILNEARVGQYMPYIDAGSKVINSATSLKSAFTPRKAPVHNSHH